MSDDYQRGYDAGRSGSRRLRPISSHEEWMGYLAGKAELDAPAGRTAAAGHTGDRYDRDGRRAALRSSVRIGAGLGSVVGAGIGALATRSLPGAVAGVCLGGAACAVLVAAEHVTVLAVTWPCRKLLGLLRPEAARTSHER